ncbi:MAG: aminotransferase class V-fold PLP-dependent enzyme [Desulfuromonadales bacterium]
MPAERVRSLARRIAGARGACPVMYTGLEYSDSGVQAIRAVFTLWALAGQLDVPGGLLFRMKENAFPQNRSGLVPNPDLRKALGRDRFPVYSHYRGESHAIALPHSVLKGDPYKIRALIVLGGSILTSWPDPALWRRTFEALDFMVCIDRYPTADSAWADIVLPATTGYEIASFMRYGPLFKVRERMVEPVGEARNDFLILAELARRLGYGHLYPQSEEEVLRHALNGSGFTLEEVRAAGGSVQLPAAMMQYKKWEKGLLRPDGRAGFNTPTGRFEIASTLLEEHGYDPLPVYTEPKEGPLARPDLARRYPLVLNSGGRTVYDFRSQHHGVKGLSAQHPEPLMVMNIADAAERGIGDGDRVWVETLRGKVQYRARVTKNIVQGAVDAEMGGGGPLGPEAWRECNVNELTDPQHYDPISGFPIYKTLLCQVTRAEEGKETEAGSGTQEPESGETPEIQASTSGPVHRVYLDHNATTPVDPEVLEAMHPFLRQEWGNPSSIHTLGNHARNAVEDARRRVAQALNCTARRVVFTNGEGVLEPDTLEQALRPDTVLVSVMLANNETGAIQPVADLARIARDRGALFHTDAVQALGKLPLDVEEMGVDLLSVSAHKVHGPKGVGALYVRKGVNLRPVVFGGGQELGLRSGTENVPGIVGFGKACVLAQRRLNEGEMERLETLRDRLEEGIRSLIPEARRNGPEGGRLPNTLNLTLPGVRGESLVLFLDRKGIFFSSGSACKSGHPEPSHALLAMGLSPEQAHCAVRFSLGWGNTAEDIEYVLECLEETLQETRKAVRFVSCR